MSFDATPVLHDFEDAGGTSIFFLLVQEHLRVLTMQPLRVPPMVLTGQADGWMCGLVGRRDVPIKDTIEYY